MAKLELFQLQKSVDRLGETVLDPTVWPDVMQGISAAVAAKGAVLLQSDNRTPDVPYTSDVSELIKAYFANGWHTHDIRADRGVPLLLKGSLVVDDSDIVTPEEIARNGMYQEAARLGFRWFAGVGFWAGDALWGLSLQRTSAEGMFTAAEKQVLAPLSRRLTEVATLSTIVGRAALSSVVNGMDFIKHAAIAIDSFGNVLDVNSAASRSFDTEFYMRRRRIVVKDQAAADRLSALFDKLRTTSDSKAMGFDPIVIRRTTSQPIVLRMLPVHPAAKNPFLSARVLLLFSSPDAKNCPNPNVLIQAFGLSKAEARLAGEVAKGASIEESAVKFGVSRDTVRNQLKAIFSKTHTHRQGELVWLLNRLTS